VRDNVVCREKEASPMNFLILVCASVVGGGIVSVLVLGVSCFLLAGRNEKELGKRNRYQ